MNDNNNNFDDDEDEGGTSYILSLVDEIASARQDARPVEKRKELVKTVCDILAVQSDARAALAGHSTNIRCSSSLGYRRVSKLYCDAILACLTGGNGDGDQGGTNDVLADLCRGLCRILKQSENGMILSECRKALGLTTSELSQRQKSGADNTEKSNPVVDVMKHIARNGRELRIPALALLPSPDWDLFIQVAVKEEPVATAGDMSLCSQMLKLIDGKSWEETVAPTVLLKLKSKPESVLSMVDVMTKHLDPDVVVSSALIVDEYLPVLLKNLKSPKESTRDLSSKIILNYSSRMIQWVSVRENPDPCKPTDTSLSKFVLALADTKGLTQPFQRQIVYHTLEQLACVVMLNRSSAAFLVDATSDVLEGICTPLAKEAKTATENRECGLNALLTWTAIAKRNNSTSGKGYEDALAFFRRPVIAKDGGETVVVLGSMVTTLHPDVVENLVLDLWKESKFVKGIDGLVEDANKKHLASSSIAPVDGLLSVYLSLVNATVSSQAELTAVVDKVLVAGSAPAGKSSFAFGVPITNAVATNPLVAFMLPRIISMYVKLRSSDTSLITTSKYKASSAMMVALACCITRPISCTFDQKATNFMETIVRKVLDYLPAVDALSQALFMQANTKALQVMERRRCSMLARDEGDANISSQGGPQGMDCNSVRRIATLLSSRHLQAQSAAMILILIHAGTSLKLNGQQRTTAERRTTELLKDLTGERDEGSDDVIATFISQITTNDISAEDLSLTELLGDECAGETVQLAALSLIVTLGRLASKFSPLTDDPNDPDMIPLAFAVDMVKNRISVRISSILDSLVEKIENLSEEDVSIYKTPKGTLFVQQPPATDDNIGTKLQGKSRRTEDEEWELQLKKDLAQKRASQLSGTQKSLSAEDKKKVEEQDAVRRKIGHLIEMKLSPALSSIETLVSSDIEIGNACLPTLSTSIIQLCVSTCPAMNSLPRLKDAVMRTLACLASCVYEIQEEHAPTMAIALTISLRNGKDKVSELPSPCEPAAITVFEMDEFQELLSGPSFAFLFPVIRAALMGPRTTPGCEGALRVLERHCAMLVGEESDVHVKPLRSDMASACLELLKHDRSQAFVDPTPYDTLVACYCIDDDVNGPVLTTSELAPLLDDRGALGGKNCRIGSMIALRSIAEQNRKVVKNNPLIETRIWLNCFDENESVRNEARRTWHAAQGTNEVDQLQPPSAMYAVPLLPLLHNPDQSIANAAASAYANGMKAHPGTVARNVERLCNAFIESTPQPGDGDDRSTASLPSDASSLAAKATVLAAMKKPLVSTGLKKKTVKKSALDVAGIGQPKKKVTKKSSALASALLKPKQERTLDQAALESQFTGKKKVEPEDDSPEKISIRSGVIGALSQLPLASLNMDFETLKMLTSFLMAYGIADRHDDIKTASRNALRDIIATYGASEEAIGFLLPHVEEILKNGAADDESLGSLSAEKVPRTAVASNCRKEGAVVALGSVALHLKGPENASKIDQTVDMLLSSLKTPNEDVQASVADALAKLMKKGNTQERIETIISQLLIDCLDGGSAPIRRGAGYGIAAAVKGSGIATLKKYGVVTKLEEACASGSGTNKEGSLFAIQLLCTRLGLLFEPYVIVLLPSLLKTFGDGSDVVRRAANKTASIVMSKLSAHGVKLVMPAVLTAFNDSNWRTKQASINMLGSMSHLAPKQLASALPKVVPKLIEAFADTHPKVKGSAQAALDEISEVIRNPEIHEMSGVLLKALTDPADNTLQALEALIATEFLHAIDAPSLALIVPILHRGLRDRTATTKRYGALITGNLCTMINDPRDFVPYLPTLMPDLQSSLLDPIPDVRSIAAKALGSLTRGLGEQSLPDLRAWLIENVRKEEISSAERSGAAQGLTEVLIASGTSTVEHVMVDDILPLKSHPSATTREGVLWVLVFLPPALGQGFTALLDSSLPALINGLSDDNEQVRDVAMRAGRVLIKSHGKVHFDKILPILRNGMVDEDYRIRLSSLMLLGDLLSMIGGTTVLRTDGNTQDDIRRAERAQAQLTLTLGIQTRNRVLSDIYLARSDNAVVVRQTAVQVWKTVVSVTARTLRQILQILVSRVVSDLASGDIEKTEVAGKCLGDIVSKLGESVLQDIIPVLRNALYDGDSSTRRGVCVGLTEVIASSTKEQTLRYLDIIVKVVQDGLCDDDASVREMAASSFQNLYSLVGNRAMDEVVPSLMVALENTDGDDHRRTRALNGLTGILSIRSRELLPYIIPRLIQKPITLHHAQALSGIAEVTGATLYYHFNAIIPPLLNDLLNKSGGDEGTESAVRACVQSVFGNSSEAGVNMLVSQIAGSCTSDKAEMRMESCWMMEVLIETRKDRTDFYEIIPVMLRELIHRLNDESMDVVKASSRALMSLSTHVPAEELVNHIEYMRNLINSMVSDARRRKGGVGDGEFLLPGFNIPKGLEPLLPIYQRGVLYGTPIIREASAAGLGEAIALTSNKFLAGPLIIKMTGPLLRIVGDRNPANVKIAILKTLGLILVKGGPALRAFVPQFQTTFVKALSDPSRQVRVEAIGALGLLMPLSTRVDPLIKELVSGSMGKNTAGVPAAGENTGAVVVVQTAILEALAVVLEKGGKKAKLPETISSALDATTTLIGHSDETIREAAAKALGAACDIAGPEKTVEVISDSILGGSNDSGDLRHGKACSIRRIFTADVSKELDEGLSDSLRQLAMSYMKDEKLIVMEASLTAVGAAIGRSRDAASSLRKAEATLLAIMNDSKARLETHQALARGLCLALELADVPSRILFFGLPMMNGCLALAMSGSQRVQFAFNDVLYLALEVAKGEAGLNEYANLAMFEESKKMKSLFSKVLVKTKAVTILND